MVLVRASRHRQARPPRQGNVPLLGTARRGTCPSGGHHAALAPVGWGTPDRPPDAPAEPAHVDGGLQCQRANPSQYAETHSTPLSRHAYALLPPVSLFPATLARSSLTSSQASTPSLG